MMLIHLRGDVIYAAESGASNWPLRAYIPTTTLACDRAQAHR